MKMNNAVLFTIVFISMPVYAGKLQWKAYHNNKGDFAMKYPSTLTFMKNGSGKNCFDKKCYPNEDFNLVKKNRKHSRPDVYVRVSVQRYFNQQHEPITKLFEEFAGKPLDPKLDKVISISGHTAIHVVGITKVTHVKLESKPNKSGNGVTFSTPGHVTKSIEPVNMLYVMLNKTDLLMLASTKPGTKFDKIFNRMISTISIKN